MRELCRATFATGSALQLRTAAREAGRHVRSLVESVADTRSARIAALDAAHVADELVRMARFARAGIGRG